MHTRSLRLFGLVLALVLFASAFVHAQSAYDSACYFPVIGDPNGYDIIYGKIQDQNFGDFIGTLPPLKGQQYGRLLMSGYPPDYESLTAVETGPTFDLHSLVK